MQFFLFFQFFNFIQYVPYLAKHGFFNENNTYCWNTVTKLTSNESLDFHLSNKKKIFEIGPLQGKWQGF